MKKLVYLCGPITGLTYEDSRFGWRRDMNDYLKDYDIECISPMRMKDHLSHESDTMSAQGYGWSAMSSQKGITARDRFDTCRSDVVVANLLGATQVSIGSCIELGWADLSRNPIVLVMEDSGSVYGRMTKNNLHDHAMVKEIASFIVPSVMDAAETVKALLIPGV